MYLPGLSDRSLLHFVLMFQSVTFQGKSNGLLTMLQLNLEPLFVNLAFFLVTWCILLAFCTDNTRSPWSTQSPRRLSNRNKRMFLAAKLSVFSTLSIVASNGCASVLNELFAKSFLNLTKSSHPDVPHHNFRAMSYNNKQCTGIVNIIANLKLSSSCGIDNLNSKFIHKTTMYFSDILTDQFRQSL